MVSETIEEKGPLYPDYLRVYLKFSALDFLGLY